MNTAQAIDRMRQIIRRQHKALSTEDCYIFWLRRYMAAVRQMSPELASEKKLEKFLTDLALHDDVSASTQNQALNAVLFFYRAVLEQPIANVNALRASRPAYERYSPTVSETRSLLQTTPNHGGYPTNFIARLLYGCGLRVSEPLNLRIKDIDLERHRLCIRGAKGGNDRVVTLPLSLIPELRQQMQLARAAWQRDGHNRTPVMLPHRLAKKYPEFQFNWGWAWLFPAHDTCRDPRTGTFVRYRMHEVNVQRAVKQARRKLGISVLPHCLRHAYASHCLDRGTNPRAIQQAMGHNGNHDGLFARRSLKRSQPAGRFTNSIGWPSRTSWARHLGSFGTGSVPHSAPNRFSPLLLTCEMWDRPRHARRPCYWLNRKNCWVREIGLVTAFWPSRKDWFLTRSRLLGVEFRQD